MNYNTNCCNKGRRIIGLLLGICLLLGLLGGLSSCVTREDITPVTAITSVELNQSGDRLSISATLSAEDASRYQNGTLALFALEPFQTLAMVENGLIAPIAQSRGSESMHFTVDFDFASGTRDRLTQRFLLASADENGIYHAVTEAVYISNPEALAGGSVTVIPDTLKGIAIHPSDDVTELSPSHTVIDIAIEAYVQSVPEKGNSISFLFAGETLSLNERAVEALDEQVRSLRAHGSQIYLRPVLATHPDALDEGLSSIGYTGSPEQQAYALNIENEVGYFYVAGFFSFLAQRYLDISGVIPGVSYNDALYNGTTVAENAHYVQNTLAVMRLAYNIFNATTSGVRIYLPVSNLYTTDGTLALTESGTREFLATFATYAKRAGDFPWSIYLTMKTPLAETDALYNESGTVNEGDVTKKYLYPQTLSQLLELLSSETLMYGSTQRDMMWGISLSGTGEGGLERQRLSLLYAYMKAIAQNAEGKSARVHAVIWETIEDTDTYAGGLFDANGTMKPSGDLFLLLGRKDLASEIDLSSVESKLGTRYAEISSVISLSSEGESVYRGMALTSADIPENSRAHLLFGEGAGYGNAFSALPGTGVVSIRRQHYENSPILTATFDDAVGCGIYTASLSSTQLRGQTMLALTVTAALPEGHSTVPIEVTVEENVSGKASRSYTARGAITDGNWSVLVFDIKEFASELESDISLTLTLSLIQSGASAETPLTLYLSKVEVYETQSWFAKGGWIWILVILLLVAVTVLFVWFFQTYEVRFTPGLRGKSGKAGGKSSGISGKRRKNKALRQKFEKFIVNLMDRLQIRPRTHTRIMVKPGTAQESDPLRERGFDATEEEEETFEPTEEFFTDIEDHAALGFSAEERFDGEASTPANDSDSDT